MQGGSSDSSSPSSATVLKRLRAAFEGADLNGDGRLQSDELGSALTVYYRQAEGMARPRKRVTAEVELLMSEYDTDSSGTLEFEEFVTMVLARGNFEFAKIEEATRREVLLEASSGAPTSAHVEQQPDGPTLEPPRPRLAPRRTMPKLASQNRKKPQQIAKELAPIQNRRKLAVSVTLEDSACQIICHICGAVTHVMSKKGELKALQYKRAHHEDILTESECDCEQKYYNASASERAEMDRQAEARKAVHTMKLVQDINDGRMAGKSRAQIAQTRTRTLLANHSLGKRAENDGCAIS